jgi:hypothetical protein
VPTTFALGCVTGAGCASDSLGRMPSTSRSGNGAYGWERSKRIVLPRGPFVGVSVGVGGAVVLGGAVLVGGGLTSVTPVTML